MTAVIDVDVSDELAGPVTVHPVADLHRRFLNDAELVAFAQTLDEARSLVYSACVPRPVRRDLAPIIDQLEQLLHARPYLTAAS